ncbi:hypothetical protein FHS31_002289 [Sphingomonas vulcanisoli]|uniref:Uncharacterized protein n=1 Tax=Sphingomonas vulcanisoli TaxID=1658060 RepID=A0ABX0TT26_9SPHN|nr:hypothetical protein [Sphingomonas vulcanisoli]NIJ08668.1 hypothetical protein [Sphingomonas vulcanisoli]
MLTALLAAAEGVETPALQPVAGVTLLEHQVRRLVAAGVERLVLLTGEWPVTLAAPLGRLRADHIAIDAVRTLADAADRLAASPRVLLVAEGCLPDRALLDRLAAAAVPTIATLPDAPEHQDWERIDAQARWAGVALIDGSRVIEAASMLGEWDPVSTLLRRAVQEGAGRLMLDAPPLLAMDAGSAAAAEAGIIRGTREAHEGWAARWIEAPLVEWSLPLLFPRSIEPLWPGALAALLALGGGLAAVAGLRWGMLVPLLAAALLRLIGRRLSAVQARALPHAQIIARAGDAGLVLASLGLGLGLMRDTGQWGWLLLGALLPLEMMLTALQRRANAWGGGVGEPAWLARGDELPWTLLPVAVVGGWKAGLAGLCGYAAATLAFQLRRGWRLMR